MKTAEKISASNWRPVLRRCFILFNVFHALGLSVSASFTPDHLTGLKLWLDAGDETTVYTTSTGDTLAINDQPVGRWEDKSGSGLSAWQSTASRRPMMVEDGLNGRPVVRFSGDQWLELGDFMSGAIAGDAFVVMRSNPASGDSALWHLGNGSWNHFTYYSDGRDIVENFGSSVLRTISRPALPLSEYHLYNISAEPGGWHARQNGRLFHNGGGNTVSFGAAAVLGRTQKSSLTYNTTTLRGDIAEVLIYDRLLSEEERDAVGLYLNGKYGFINEPVVPVALEATALSNTQISLTWKTDAGDGMQIFELERRSVDSPESTFELIAAVRDRMGYLDGEVNSGIVYEYRVRARNYGGMSDYSVPVSVATPDYLEAGMPVDSLRLWLRADAGLAAGGVGTWPDQSGRGADAVQTAGSRRPMMVEDGLNGRPVVRFSGDQWFELGDFMSGATAGDAFVVMRSNPGSGDSALWHLGNGSWNHFTYYSDGRDIVENFGSSTLRTISRPALPLSEYHLYNVSAESGAWHALQNGRLFHNGGGNTVSFGAEAILGRTQKSSLSYNTTTLRGDIAEVLIYDRVLSHEERRSINYYLFLKYNIGQEALFILPDDRIFDEAFSVTFSTTAEYESIFYTVDGSYPSTINGLLFDGEINISETTRLRAIAYDAEGIAVTNEAEAYYRYGQVASPVTAVSGWSAEYFQGNEFSGSSTRRLNPILNDPSFADLPSGWNVSTASARFEAAATPQFSEDHIFSLRSNGGVRVWFDGNLVVEDWSGTGTRTLTFTRDVIAGSPYTVLVEYQRKSTANPQLRLEWESALQPKAVVPQSQVNSGWTHGVAQATPVANPAAGVYPNVVEVDLTVDGAPTGTQVRYTLDGTLPNENSLLFETALFLTNETHIRAIAYAPDYELSGVLEARFAPQSTAFVEPTRLHRVEVAVASSGYGTLTELAFEVNGEVYYLEGSEVSTTTPVNHGSLPDLTNRQINSFPVGIQSGGFYEIITPEAVIATAIYAACQRNYNGSFNLPPYIRYLVSDDDGETWVELMHTGPISWPLGLMRFPVTRAGVTFHPEPGLFESSVSVELDSDLWQSSIYYTLDGSIPDPENGVLYEGPFPVGVSSVLRASAFNDATWTSPTIALYEIGDPLTDLSPESGVFAEYLHPTMSGVESFRRLDAVPGAGLDALPETWTDGALSGAASADLIARFNEPHTLIVRSNGGVRVVFDGVAAVDDLNGEGLRELSFEVDLVAGTRYPVVLEFAYADTSEVPVLDVLWGRASMAPEVIPQSQWDSGLDPAAVAGHPQGPLSGTYDDVFHPVFLSDTEGARLHYSIDGSEPTEVSPLYDEDLLVDGSTTIKVRAFADDHQHSGVAIFNYTMEWALVKIPDPALADALRLRLGLNPEDSLDRSHLRSLSGDLDLSGRGISDLESLQFATGITSLNLSDNLIHDLTPIVGLTQLEALNLSGNRLDLDAGSVDLIHVDAFIANETIINVEDQERFTLTVSVNGGGAVAVDPERGDYGFGAVVGLTALSEGFNRFGSWSGAITQTQPGQTVIVDASLAITANFIEGVAVGTGDGLVVDTYDYSSSPVPSFWNSFTGTGYRTRLVKSSSTSAGTKWITSSPASTFTTHDYFTCRLQGQVEARYSEDFIFTVKADDNIAVYLDGVLIVSNIGSHWNADYYSEPIALVAGQKYDLEILYRELAGDQFFYLDWQTPTLARHSIPPTQLYSGFEFSGTPTFASAVLAAYYEEDGLTEIDAETAGLKYGVGPLSANAQVHLATNDANDIIRYTLDGSEPSVTSLRYTGPIILSENITLKARAFGGDKYPGGLFTGVYTIDSNPPVLSDLQLPNVGAPGNIHDSILSVGGAADQFISIHAADASPMHHVTFSLISGHDPEPFASAFFLGRVESGDAEGDGVRFRVPFDIFNFPDGDWTLRVEAADVLGNAVSAFYAIAIAITQPAPPVLSAPLNESVFSAGDVVFSGTARKDSKVRFEFRTVDTIEPLSNWQPIGNPVAVNSGGAFSTALNFLDNAPDQRYEVRAFAEGRSPSFLISGASAIVQFVVDSSVPAAPVNLQSRAVADGKIRISWAADPTYNGIISKYRIEYRYEDPAGSTWGAWQALADVPASTFSYLFDPEGAAGRFAFRVRALRMIAGDGEVVSSEADAPVSAAVTPDSVPPTLTLTYKPTREGQLDPEDQRFGPGFIDIEVLASEPLSGAPYLAFAHPGGGVPIRVNLLTVDSGRYEGSLPIKEGAASGVYTAYAVARDLAGNESKTGGSYEPITEGPSVWIDAQGPQLIILEPAIPAVLKNESVEGGGTSTSFAFTFEFDEALLESEQVTAFAQWGDGLPHPINDPEDLSDGVFELTVTVEAGQGYDGAAPSDNVQTDQQNINNAVLYLYVTATDTLNNVSISEIPGIFVYRDVLPRPAPPVLHAEALPGGELKLVWHDVPEATRYQLVIVDPSETTEVRRIEIQRLDLTETVEYFYEASDLPEGMYEVYVYGERPNGEGSSDYVIGFASETVSISTDNTPPPPVESVTLFDEVPNAVIRITWAAPVSGDLSDIAFYHVYRTTSFPTDTEAARAGTLIKGNVRPTDQFVAHDSQPYPGEAYYVLVTTDAVGNASMATMIPSRNIALVPPATVTIHAVKGERPVLSWSPVAAVADGGTYSVYRMSGSERVLLEEGLTDTSLTDSTWISGARTYVVESVKGENTASRDIVFPGRFFDFAPDAVLYEGLPAQVSIVREDADNANLWSNLYRHRLSMQLPGGTVETGVLNKDSIAFGLDGSAGDETQAVIARLTLTPVSDRDFGTSVIYTLERELPVETRLPVLSLAAGAFTRGAAAEGIEVTIRNPSESPIRINLSESGTSAPLFLKLLDGSGNVLAEQRVTGTNRTISGGGSITLTSIAFNVPESAPASAILQAELRRYHGSETGQSFDRSQDPIASRLAVSTAPLSYSAFITAPLVDAAVTTTGSEQLILRARALQADGVTPAIAVPVVLGFSSGSYQRVFTLISDNQGNVSYSFLPAGSEPGGTYKVWAKHPDLTRTPGEADGIGQFIYQKIVTIPKYFTVRMPRNFEQGTPIKLQWPDGLILEDVTVEIVNGAGAVIPLSEQNALGYAVQLPEIAVDPNAPSGGSSLTLTPKLGGILPATSSNYSSEASYLYRVSARVAGAADHSVIGEVPTYAYFTEAFGQLTGPSKITPLGVLMAAGGTQDDSNLVQFRNTGLIPLSGIRFELMQQTSGGTGGYQPAPSWIELVRPSRTELAQGSSISVQVATRLSGLATLPAPGRYYFDVIARSNEAPLSRATIEVALTEDSDSSFTLHVINIYYGYDASTVQTDTSGIEVPAEYIDGVAGARVTLQRDDVEAPDPDIAWAPPELHTEITASGGADHGKATFNSIPAGRYRITVRAPKHEPYTSTFRVRPDQTEFEQIPLNFGAVTVEWDVREITIEDRYDVKIETTFDTRVPAPVVVITPAAISLPAMCPGDVYEVELLIENKGILSALDFKNPIPKSDAYLRVEPITDLPESFDIPAQQTVRVAFRYICLKPLPNSPCE